MHHFLLILPIKPIDELKNPTRFVQLLIQQLVDIVDMTEMVNRDVEVDGVAAVVSGDKGAEAMTEGGEAIEGEKLENEREIKEIWSGV